MLTRAHLSENAKETKCQRIFFRGRTGTHVFPPRCQTWLFTRLSLLLLFVSSACTRPNVEGGLVCGGGGRGCTLLLENSNKRNKRKKRDGMDLFTSYKQIKSWITNHRLWNFAIEGWSKKIRIFCIIISFSHQWGSTCSCWINWREFSLSVSSCTWGEGPPAQNFERRSHLRLFCNAIKVLKLPEFKADPHCFNQVVFWFRMLPINQDYPVDLLRSPLSSISSWRKLPLEGVILSR